MFTGPGTRAGRGESVGFFRKSMDRMFGSTSSRLFGRTSTGWGPISIGSNLSLSGNTLSAGTQPVASGTSNPGSPSTNDLFFRTDLGYIIYYDGTRWLTLELFAPTLSTTSNTGIGLINSLGIPGDQTYDMWLVDYCFFTQIVTNTGSAYWAYSFKLVQPNGTIADPGGSPITFDTSADTANNRTRHSGTIGASVARGTYTAVVVSENKTGSPSASNITGQIRYRLIIT